MPNSNDAAFDNMVATIEGIVDAARLSREIPPEGKCFNCGTEVEHPKKFCDIECSEEWNEWQLSLKRNGKG